MIPLIARKITSYVLVFILFAHNINTLAIIGDFVINQEFIAKTLCVQKEAQKGCNGKCQLRKELSESNTTSHSDIPFQQTKQLVLDAFFISDINEVNTPSLEFQSQKQKSISNVQKLIKMYLEIDTPPPNIC
ncbi:hypothetical protein [Psychroserpens mesophilus]|uniref:hypothetical protein n=1 Tax=Psychroserpens mesophilus TaxID=325473 RepID=UPI003D64E6CE